MPHLSKAQRSKKYATSGQTLVEFALIMPVLFLTIFAVFEFSIYVSVTDALHHAALEGVHAASVYASYTTPGSPNEGDDLVCQAIERSLAGDKVNTGNLGPVTIYNPAASGLSQGDTGTCSPGSSMMNETTSNWLPQARVPGANPGPIGVTFTYQFHFLLPYLPLMNGPITLSDTAQQQMEPTQ